MKRRCRLLALVGQRPRALVSGRKGPAAGSGVAGDDVHELQLRFQPHPSQTSLPQLRAGESRAAQERRAGRLAPKPGLLWAQIVCRSCSRNRHQLKYMKDRAANVCDRCYAELKKRGELCRAARLRRGTHRRRPSSPLCPLPMRVRSGCRRAVEPRQPAPPPLQSTPLCRFPQYPSSEHLEAPQRHRHLGPGGCAAAEDGRR